MIEKIKKVFNNKKFVQKKSLLFKITKERSRTIIYPFI